MLSGQQDATGHSRIGGLDGAEHDDDEDEPVNRGLPRRAARQNRVKAKPLSGKHTEVNDSLGSMDDESDATSSGNEWDGGDEDEPEDHVDDDEEDEDVDMSDNSGAEEEGDDPRQSLVVSLRYIKSRPSPPSQDTPKVAAISKDHSIAQMTSANSKGSSETAYSTDDLTKPLQDAPKSIQDAAHTQYSRSTAAAQYAAPTDPRPQAGHSGQSTPIAPEKYHTPFHPNHSQPEEHPAPAASWSRPETGVVAPNRTQM